MEPESRIFENTQNLLLEGEVFGRTYDGFLSHPSSIYAWKPWNQWPSCAMQSSHFCPEYMKQSMQRPTDSQLKRGEDGGLRNALFLPQCLKFFQRLKRQGVRKKVRKVKRLL